MVPCLRSEDKEQAEKLTNDLMELHLPIFFGKLAEQCLGESKFLCGDEISIYDFRVGSFFTSFITKLDHPLGEACYLVYDYKAPERLK